MSDKPSLEGKTALITGAAKRLGRVIALALADRGANIVVHYNHSRPEAEELADSLRSKNRRAWALGADLQRPDEVARLADAAVSLNDGVHVLINNASIFPGGRIEDATREDLLTNLQVHAFAPLDLSRRLTGKGGCRQIVNMLDTRIVDLDREHAAYHISKRVLFTLTRMLAMELAPDVTVNAVAPGLILPPPGKDESYLQRLAHTNPLQRHGEVADIARAVLFLLDSPFITGQVIFVDGGRHMKGNMYG